MKENKNKRIKYNFSDHCVCCGILVPEGFMVCPNCEAHPTSKSNIQLKKILFLKGYKK